MGDKRISRRGLLGLFGTTAASTAAATVALGTQGQVPAHGTPVPVANGPLPSVQPAGVYTRGAHSHCAYEIRSVLPNGHVSMSAVGYANSQALCRTHGLQCPNASQIL